MQMKQLSGLVVRFLCCRCFSARWSKRAFSIAVWWADLHEWLLFSRCRCWYHGLWMRLKGSPCNAVVDLRDFCLLKRVDRRKFVLEFWWLPCEKQNRFVMTMASIPDILHCSRTLVFVTLSCQWMCKIFLRQHSWNSLSCLIYRQYGVHASHP